MSYKARQGTNYSIFTLRYPWCDVIKRSNVKPNTSYQLLSLKESNDSVFTGLSMEQPNTNKASLSAFICFPPILIQQSRRNIDIDGAVIRPKNLSACDATHSSFTYSALVALQIRWLHCGMKLDINGHFDATILYI